MQESISNKLHMYPDVQLQKCNLPGVAVCLHPVDAPNLIGAMWLQSTVTDNCKILWVRMAQLLFDC